MKTYLKEDLEKYLQNDWILELLLNSEEEYEKNNRTNEWLKEMDNKRLIYADVYGDILKGEISPSTKVLDVGGGLSALTKVLARNSDYTLLDFLAHGGQEIAVKQGINLIDKDWNEIEIKPFDIIFANDIFPDVDQKMDLFIEKMLPFCKEMRLVITYYNCPKYYTAKRIDDSEILTFLSYDGEITAVKLRKYSDKLLDTSKQQLEDIKDNLTSIYRNGRQVSYVRIKGEAK